MDQITEPLQSVWRQKAPHCRNIFNSKKHVRWETTCRVRVEEIEYLLYEPQGLSAPPPPPRFLQHSCASQTSSHNLLWLLDVVASCHKQPTGTLHFPTLRVHGTKPEQLVKGVPAPRGKQLTKTARRLYYTPPQSFTQRPRHASAPTSSTKREFKASYPPGYVLLDFEQLHPSICQAHHQGRQVVSGLVTQQGCHRMPCTSPQRSQNTTSRESREVGHMDVSILWLQEKRLSGGERVYRGVDGLKG